MIFSAFHSKLHFLALALTVGVICVAVRANPLPEDEARQVEQAQKQALVSEAQLVGIGEGANESNTLTFDFGSVDQMDDAQAVEDLVKRANLERVLTGIKHLFTLKNTSQNDVTISYIQDNCICIQTDNQCCGFG